MDYDMQFSAVADSVTLDRTPISGEPEGQSWGGYAGLSIRFNQDFMDPVVMADKPGSMRDEPAGSWYYMGFRGIDGKRVGSAIVIADISKRAGEAWYIIEDHELPFWYFSPAYLYFKPLVLKKGESISLTYRVQHIEGNIAAGEMDNSYRIYSAIKNN
jgi:hypothetical protein